MLKELDKHLKRTIRKHSIPGASVAVLRGKRITATAAAGVVNINTRVPTTTDAVFQIGSITKPMTATMIMQLKDEGRLQLDDFLVTHLPDFRNADMARLQKVTIRHLLSHQSGIDGDFFPTTDSGDRSIEQFLSMCSMLPSLFEPGTNWSYCNVGFAVLGRIIELKDNRTFDQSLKARIFNPLGMTHAISQLEENLKFRVAVGHVPDAKNPKQLIVPEQPFLSFGQKAAGSTPAMTAEDLLRFAAAHMHGGTGINGTKLLSRSAAREMLRIENKNGANPVGMTGGLAWWTTNWNGNKVFGHDGGTVGQYSQLLIMPGKRLAIAALTNGGNAAGLFSDIVGGLFKSLTRVSPPGLPKPRTNVSTRANQLIGTFENINLKVTIFEEEGVLKIKGGLRELSPSEQSAKLEFINSRFARFPLGMVEWTGPAGESADAIRIGSRLLART